MGRNRLDWRFHQTSSPGGSQQLQESLEAIYTHHGVGVVKTVGAGRQFDSEAIRR
ncbi:MAG: hypothetical protein M2R45_04896 [Verrucomicrobia subdivision 3 bacterium]|nr:hypothetical protein [Limisphaerales bacterium]